MTTTAKQKRHAVSLNEVATNELREIKQLARQTLDIGLSDAAACAWAIKSKVIVMRAAAADLNKKNPGTARALASMAAKGAMRGVERG